MALHPTVLRAAAEIIGTSVQTKHVHDFVGQIRAALLKAAENLEGTSPPQEEPVAPSRDELDGI